MISVPEVNSFCFLEQMISVGKYPSIFLGQIEGIVCTLLIIEGNGKETWQSALLYVFVSYFGG